MEDTEKTPLGENKETAGTEIDRLANAYCEHLFSYEELLVMLSTAIFRLGGGWTKEGKEEASIDRPQRELSEEDGKLDYLNESNRRFSRNNGELLALVDRINFLI